MVWEVVPQNAPHKPYPVYTSLHGVAPCSRMPGTNERQTHRIRPTNHASSQGASCSPKIAAQTALSA